MPPFERRPLKFAMGGMNLNRPVDLLGDFEYRYLKNVRSYTEGRIEARPGLVEINGVGSGDYVHSIRRMNDYNPDSPSSYARVIGADTKLYYGQASFSLVEGGYSGNPLSLIPFQPDQVPVPWMYIGDSADYRMRKLRADGTIRKMGIAPPVSAPSGSAGSAGNLKGDYYYRCRPRASETGAKGNPSPANRTAITADDEEINLTLSSHTDAQVDLMDVFRFGGVVKAWRYVGTGSKGASFTDNRADSEISGADSLSFDNYQPFPSVGMSKSGTCSVSGYIVTKTGGGDFDIAWPAGTEIIIDGTPFEVYKVVSTSILETTKLPGDGSALSWNVTDPMLLGQSVPYLWGPYGGGIQGAVLFGCGDPRQPGFLLWTNGNDPDSASPDNSVELTSPSEPLMNGCWYDGRSYVWSSERLFAAFPSLTGNNQYYAQVVPSAKGLVAPWAFAVGPKLWWVSKDGIYEGSGPDGVPASITDEQLYPLFPHDTQPAVEVNGIKPPLFTAANRKNIRLAYANGYLYFDFKDTNGDFRSLVYDTVKRKWVSLDVYNPSSGAVNSLVHYLEEGEGTYPLLVGAGQYIYNQTGVSDDGNAIASQVKPGYLDFGDSRTDKLHAEVLFDSDPAGNTISVDIKGDNGSTSLATGQQLTGSTRTRTIVDINSGVGTLARNITVELSWSSTTSTAKLYEWHPAFVPRPEETKRRATDWTDDGHQGAKYLRGAIIKADTGGVAKSVDIERDDGTVVASLTINHNGELVKPYAFTPAVAHHMRLMPKDAETWRLFPATWVWDPYPEDSQIQDDFEDGGQPGAKHVRGFLLEADTGGGNVSFQVQYDGGTVAGTPTANHTGRQAKPYAFATPFVAKNLRVVPLADWRKFKVVWIYDPWPFLSTIISPYSDAGFPGAKYVRGVLLDADTENASISVQIQKDEAALAATLSAVQHNGRGKQPYAFTTPFIAHLMRFKPLANWRFFQEGTEWIYDKYPELSKQGTGWTNLGYAGDKFVQGIRLCVDTENASISIQVLKDGGAVATTLTGVQHNGKQTKPYAWTPFIAHDLRLLPLSNVRIFEDQLEWIWEPMPELAVIWQTQPTTHDLPGYQHLRDAYIAHMATANISLVVTKDGSPQSAISIAHNSGNYKKSLVEFPVMKAKDWEYKLTSAAGFRLFKKDCEVRVKAWGDPGPYRIANPFGDVHRVDGARI